MQAASHAPAMARTFKQILPEVLRSIPDDWRGTTYKNSNLLGRAGFSRGLADLAASGQPVTVASLAAVGIAEDYFRVSSNMTTTLEYVLAEDAGVPIDQVFTFASRKMPIIALGLTTGGSVDLYCGEEPAPFSQADLAVLQHLGVSLAQHGGSPQGTPGPGRVVAALESAARGSQRPVDAVVAPFALYIHNAQAVKPADVLVIRKRLATPVTNPMAEAWLQRLAGVVVTADRAEASPAALAEFHAHLQTLSGTAANPAANPVVFTAGLPAIASMWLTLIASGGCNVLMASTAYGGSSQLTGIIEGNCATFKRTEYDIQGAAAMLESIRVRLDELSAHPELLLPTTVLFSEIPTNPDMKVPDMEALGRLIAAYRAKTGKDFVFLVDATFAPGSKVMAKFAKYVPDLPVLCFVSMSKSISRGLTTAGAIVANHTPQAISILKGVGATSAMLDTNAKRDQLWFLTENHTNVEQRNMDAYAVHRAVGDHLVAAVHTATGQEMHLHTVTPENAAEGFTSSTFSFNLPAPEGATADVTAGLAQKFVDLLCTNPNFKPCVSFGQDNGLTYCTVPATSTQGAIKEEDKAKQAVGGVQLTRLSFPPSCDLASVKDQVTAAVKMAYPEASKL